MKALTPRGGSVLIGGHVMDSETEETIPGAHVYVLRDGKPAGGVTDPNGFYSLEVAPGEMVKVSFVGYTGETFTAPDTMPDAPLEHFLERSSSELDEFEVFGERRRSSLIILGALALISYATTRVR